MAKREYRLTVEVKRDGRVTLAQLVLGRNFVFASILDCDICELE